MKAERHDPTRTRHRAGSREPAAKAKSSASELARRISRLTRENAKLRRALAHGTKFGGAHGKKERTPEELRQLSRRLLLVQEEERKRISRELHDVVAQALSSINVHLTLLKGQSAANTKDLHRKIAVTQQLVRKSVEIVHRFARDLRPAVLDDLGLVPALRSHLKIAASESRLRISFKCIPAVESLGIEEKTVLYRVLQEAMANIVQHAKATKVAVVITRRAGVIRMTVRDNGRGFRIRSVLAKDTGAHLGLLGMRERVEMIGGVFAVESTPGRSTTVRVSVPSAAASGKAEGAR